MNRMTLQYSGFSLWIPKISEMEVHDLRRNIRIQMGSGSVGVALFQIELIGAGALPVGIIFQLNFYSKIWHCWVRVVAVSGWLWWCFGGAKDSYGTETLTGAGSAC